MNASYLLSEAHTICAQKSHDVSPARRKKKNNASLDTFLARSFAESTLNGFIFQLPAINGVRPPLADMHTKVDESSLDSPKISAAFERSCT